MANRSLPQALDLYHQFGWKDAKQEDLPNLPIGDAAQQKLAVQGLKSGDWDTFEATGSHGRYVSLLGDADQSRLALFGLRCGITARRYVQINRFILNRVTQKVQAECIAQRGAAFVQSFMAEAARGTVNDADTTIFVDEEHNFTSLLLVSGDWGFDVPLPEHVNYLRVWAMAASAVMNLDVVKLFEKPYTNPVSSFDELKNRLTWEDLEPRFLEHLEAAVNNQVPMSGPLGHVVAEALRREMITRATAVKWVADAVESTTRTGARRRMVEMCKELEVTDEELLAHANSLAGAVSAGDGSYLQYFGVRLIGIVPDENLCDVALPGLYSTVLKAQRMVLKALAERPTPTLDVCEVLQPRIVELAGAKDRQVARAANGVLTVWVLAQDPGITDAPTEADDLPTASLWQPTPPLWKLERFEVPEATVEQITHNVALVERDMYDVHALERLLAQVVELAIRDEGAAKRACRSSSWAWGWLDSLLKWAKDAPAPQGVRETTDPWSAITEVRGNLIVKNLGSYPCVLSTPSFVDCSISREDFFARLDLFQETGQAVAAPDLALALYRLDLDGCNTDTLADSARRYSDIPILISADQTSKKSVGVVVAEYLASPVVEPPLQTGQGWANGEKRAQWVTKQHPTPPTFLTLGIHKQQLTPHRWSEMAIIHPRWDDAAYTEMSWTRQADQQRLNVLAAHAAHRKYPLTPAIAVNLLGCVRPTARKTLSTVGESIRQAWDRGLLHPGVVDVDRLDWVIGDTHFKGLAQPLLELAYDGLLSIIWPLFDALLYRASPIEKPVPGASDIAEAMAELAPYVAAALKEKKAPEWAALVPGARAFAAKKGGSKTVRAAKAIVAALPESPAHDDSPHQADEFKPAPAETVTTRKWKQATACSRLVDTHAKLHTVAARSVASSGYGKNLRSADLWLVSPVETPEGEKLYIRSLTDFSDFRFNDTIFVSTAENPKPSYLQEEPWQLFHSDGAWAVSRRRQAPGGGQFPITDVVLTATLVFATHDDADDVTEFLLHELSRNEVSSGDISQVMRRLLPRKEFNPHRLFTLVSVNAEFLPYLWPIVTESIAHAAQLIQAGSAAPSWLKKALGSAMKYVKELSKATDEGLVDDSFWESVALVATSQASDAITILAKKIVKHRQPQLD